MSFRGSIFLFVLFGFIVCGLFGFVSCSSHAGNDAEEVKYAHTAVGDDVHFDLPEIQQNGELIILTLYGAESFFEFRGEYFGLQYMIAREYAKSIGTSLRVEVARNQREMLDKLLKGEGDIIAYCIDEVDSLSATVDYVGGKEMTSFLDSLSRQRHDVSLSPKPHTSWAVSKNSPMLSASLREWIADNHTNFFDYTTIHVKGKHSNISPRRKSSAPMLNAAKGQISHYDDIFKQYAIQCGWDWKLLAAQAYQESSFDPNAVSFMGAMGLMQLMPNTARQVGVSDSEVFVPQSNVRGAVKLINQLNEHYSSITNADERINFILAAYNAGPGHIDDARKLARKYGKDANVWHGNVDAIVLRMSEPQYYNQPEVTHGYLRGSETYNYVQNIRALWDDYRRKIRH